MDWLEFLFGLRSTAENRESIAETAQETVDTIQQRYDQAVASVNSITDALSNLRRKYNALVTFRDTLESYKMSFGGDVLYNSSLLTDCFEYCCGPQLDNIYSLVGTSDCSSDSIHGSSYLYSEDLDGLIGQVNADIAEIDYSINQLAVDLLSAESLVSSLLPF